MHLVNALLIALAAYTRVPVPRAAWTAENRRFALCFFPLAGALCGAALAVWLAACDALGFGAMLRGAVGAAIPLLVTGGLHMDGFMDTCDALASLSSRERRLEILKDSRVGAFAAMGCAAVLLAQAGIFSEARVRDAAALAACFVCSRAMSAIFSLRLPQANPNGSLADAVRASNARAAALASCAWLMACLGAWLTAGAVTAALCVLATALCALRFRRMALRDFGGVTGDLAGWLVVVTETALVAAVILGGKL